MKLCLDIIALQGVGCPVARLLSVTCIITQMLCRGTVPAHFPAKRRSIKDSWRIGCASLILICTDYPAPPFRHTMLHSVRGSLLRQAQHCLRASRNLPSPFQSSTARYLSSLAVLEQREGKLQKASLSAVTAAQKFGGTVTGIVAGRDVKSVAKEASLVKGLDKIIVIENAAYDKVRLLLTSYTQFPHLLSICYRVFRKTTLLFLLKISRKKGSHTS